MRMFMLLWLAALRAHKFCLILHLAQVKFCEEIARTICRLSKAGSEIQ